ncbi:hypothetical protein PVT01_000094700, partial [Plasmodium vivax]
MSFLYRWSFNNLFKRQDGGCLNKYHTVKSDIERQIDAFNKIKGKKVQREWDRLNTFIINKDKELKECYDNEYVKVKLIDDDIIKNFTKECNRNRTCDNRATPAKKTTITKAPEQRNCKNRDDCKKETSVTDGVKSQSKLSSGAANPQSSERNVSQEQGQNKADLQKLRQESVVSQSQSVSTPSGASVRTHENSSKEIVNYHSTIPGEVETQEQQLKALVTSGISDLGSPPSDHSSQLISAESSDLTCTSRGKNLGTIGIQTNPNCDKELKECYKNGHVKVKLTDVDEINNFRNKCNRNRTCKNRATPANLPPIIKHTTQRTCNKGEKCKKKTAVTDDVKSQSRSVSGGANPPSSEIKIPQEQGQNQADGQKPRRESVVSQSQSITMPSGSSVGTNVNTSQEIVNHHSTTSAVVENQERPLNASSPPGNRGMDSPPSDHSLQRISGETSDLTYTSTGEILNSKDIQTNQYSGKTLDANNPQTQDSAGNVTAEQTSGGKDITSEIAHNLSPTESTSGSVQRVEVDPHPTATVGGSTSTVFSDSGKTGSEAVSNASLASASRVVGNNGVTYVAISNDFKAPDGEIKSDKVSHDHIYGSEGLCTEGTCNEAQNTEITSNNNNNDILGTLSRVFNNISPIESTPGFVQRPHEDSHP